MPWKRSGRRVESQPAISEDGLRRMFDVAVREIYQADPARVVKPARRGIAIVPRERILRLCQPGSEKRAIADAARALAQLWKV